MMSSSFAWTMPHETQRTVGIDQERLGLTIRDMMTTTYDVVIATHGRRSDYLRATIDSVLKQTLSPERVIVVVDGNPTAAAALTNERGEQITVVTLAMAAGPAAARRVGIQIASSTWVAFVDDDDLWASHKQERLVDYLLAHPGCRAVRAGYWTFTEPGGTHSGLFGQTPELEGSDLRDLADSAATTEPRNDLSYLDIQGRSLELLLERNRSVIGTSMVAREVLLSMPEVPDVQPGDDYLLAVHVAAHTEWHLVEERLMYYRLHRDQGTRLRGAKPALAILESKRIAWRNYGAQSRQPLAAYGPEYAREIRGFWWTVLRQTSSVGSARAVIRAGFPLLPRWRDRVSACVPAPVAYRLQRLQSQPKGSVTPSVW